MANTTYVGSLRLRVFLSVVVSLHVMAVFAEPFRFFTRSSRGTSPAADPVRNALGPYIELTYLNHGYFFFAPEPGPSHLMRCKLVIDGAAKELQFPDRTAQWPRLLYHRHFMYSEFLHQLHAPPVPPEILGEDSMLASDWRRDRSRFVSVRTSMEKHLKWRYGAQDVRIDRVEHRLPSSDEVLLEKKALNDPSLYLVLPDGEASASEPTAVPERLPSGRTIVPMAESIEVQP